MFDVTFSVNQYDHEGDIIEQGLYLDFGHTSIKVATSISEFDDLIEQLVAIRKEVSENYIDFQDLSANV